MAQPFIGEIRMMGFDFNPRDWALCDGQIFPIQKNPALFSLLGNTFGGDGINTFALPDLRGRSPLGIGTFGSSHYSQADQCGVELVKLLEANLPCHSHQMLATNYDGDSNKAINNSSILAKSDYTGLLYSKDPSSLVNLAVDSVSMEGGNQFHYNMQPTQVINFCIALEGLYPSRPYI
ncbi:MAG: phage tail protein [Halarcobacter sp.]